ncbi:MAG: HmuY family protein [Gemmatimonadaceae bacterium]
MARVEGRAPRVKTPWPLAIGFAVFVVAMGYLVASSLTRRAAPTFAPTLEARGDTLTVDATAADRWRYVSLTRGRVLSPPDTAGWEIAVRRYNLIANGDVVDLGPAAFDTVRDVAVASEANSSAISRWYRYSLLTHLLEPNDHVYVVRAGGGPLYKLQILSYYCPGLTAGCMTIRYAPLTSE